jgi:hypothetical protein
MYSKQSINASSEALYAGKANYKVVDNSAMEIYKKEQKKAKQDGLSHLYNSDYKPASYQKALQFRDSMSYRKKVS